MSSTAKLGRKEPQIRQTKLGTLKKGKIETVTLGESGVTIGRSIFEPGVEVGKMREANSKNN